MTKNYNTREDFSNQGLTDDPTDPGTGGDTGDTGNTGNGGWDWDAAWDGIGSIFDTVAKTWGNPPPPNGYPYQQPATPASTYMTYGIFALVIIVALALILKFIK